MVKFMLVVLPSFLVRFLHLRWFRQLLLDTVFRTFSPPPKSAKVHRQLILSLDVPVLMPLEDINHDNLVWVLRRMEHLDPFEAVHLGHVQAWWRLIFPYLLRIPAAERMGYLRSLPREGQHEFILCIPEEDRREYLRSLPREERYAFPQALQERLQELDG